MGERRPTRSPSCVERSVDWSDRAGSKSEPPFASAPFASAPFASAPLASAPLASAPFASATGEPEAPRPACSPPQVKAPRGRFKGPIIPSPEECQALRSRLEWSQERLAEKAGLTIKTVVDFEAGVRTPHPRTLIAVRAALRQAGASIDAFVTPSGAR